MTGAIAIVVGAIALAYGAALAWLWWRQEALMFYPVPLPADQRLATDPDVHELFVEVPGARLSVLHLQLPQPRGVVFFLHGNAGNLASWFVNAAFYRDAGYDLVMPDYRGYGKSSGHVANEAQLLADARAVWATVAPRYDGLARVFYGRSLGTGLAAQLAAELQPELTVLVSPYLSMQALAREHYPLVPAFVLRYPLRTDLALPRIAGPVLLVQGTNDELIGSHHSLALQALAGPGREVTILQVEGAMHNDIHTHATYRQAFARALDDAARRRSGAR